MKKKIIHILLIIIVISSVASVFESKDEWHYSDGTEIVCRVTGCGKTPVYSDWEDRYCVEHLDKSENHGSEYDSTVATKKVNTKKALTKEEADALRGTGYKGTRPNSMAESNELKAAMVACENCGMHSSNGSNSLCDECRYNEEYGFD